MSWKASGYVKAIIEGISPAEKLLLLVLADYHNTARSGAWPSLDILAREALMSKRNASRILANLEGRFLRRMVGVGRGNLTSYMFIGLDCGKDDKLASFNSAQKGTQKVTYTAKKVDTMGNAIRKEPKATGSLEPVLSENLLRRMEQDRRDGIAQAKAMGLTIGADGKTCHRSRGGVSV